MLSGYEQTFKSLVEVGPTGILARPDLIFHMLVNVAAQQTEASTGLGCLDQSVRQQHETLYQIQQQLKGAEGATTTGGEVGEELAQVKAQVADLVALSNAHNEQIQHTKQAISMLHRQAQGGGHPVPPVGGNMGADDRDPSELAGRLASLEEKVERLDRMHDILSERMGINQIMIEKVQKMEAQHRRTDELTVLAKKVDAMEGKLEVEAAERRNVGNVASWAEKWIKKIEGDDLEAIRKEIRRVEKKLVTALGQVAQRLNSSSNDTTAASARFERSLVEEGTVLHARLQDAESKMVEYGSRMDALETDKVSTADLNGLFEKYVKECTMAWGDELENLYQIFELNKPDVQWAVAGSRADKLKVLHAMPCLSTIAAAVQRLDLGRVLQPPIQGQAPSPRNIGDEPRQYPVLGLEITDGGGKAGVRVASVIPGGPAYNAGIGVGDRLLAFNGIPSDTRNDFMLACSQAKPHSTVQILRLPEGASVPVNTSLVVGSSPISPSTAQVMRRATMMGSQGTNRPAPAAQVPGAAPWR